MKMNAEMQKLISEELAYIATVDNEGNPNIGPKRTMRYLDETHLLFCENTNGKHHANIKANGKISVAFAKRNDNYGFRFSGTAKSYTDEEHMAMAEKLAGARPKTACIIIEVEKIYILDSGPKAGKLYE